jgi:hypothetical protein
MSMLLLSKLDHLATPRALVAFGRQHAALDREVFLEVEVLDERVEVLAVDLAGLDERHLGRHRAVGPDVEHQAVVVGRLADARVLDRVAHAVHGAEDRVDRDGSDLELLGHVLLGGDVAATLAHLHLAEETHVLGQRADLELGVRDLDVRVALDLLGAHFTLLVGVDAQRRRRVRVQLDAQLLDVQHDLRDVFEHALDRRELVNDAVDAHPRDGRALDRGQQHAPQAVADGGAETLLEGLDRESAERRGRGFPVQPDL